MQDLKFWLAAIHAPCPSPKKFKHCLEIFFSIEHIFIAPESELQRAGLSAKEIAQIKNPDWCTINKEIEWCAVNDCHIITWNDDRYPLLLKETHDAPLILFVRGEVELLSQPQLAMVGTRNPTASALETAQSFAKHLSQAGLAITSGLAIGIDAASHAGALEGGKTIAVLGSGLFHIYPALHRKLADKIISNGALVSEFAPFEMPKAKNFPRRNRIISGMSVGVLVVEAALRSGSLITARTAIEQDREVFAIPGSIHNPLAKGCHYLLRQGAKLVETADDIIEELAGFLDLLTNPRDNPSKKTSHQIPDNQLYILDKIGYETTSLDTIITRSGLTPDEVSSILLGLELEGYVQTTLGGYTRITSKTA